MLIVDKLLVSGLRFVLTRVVDAVEREMDDADVLREELLAAQMQLELGEIDDAEFAAVETAVLTRLRELHGGGSEALSFRDAAEGSVDVSVDLRGDGRR